MPLHVDPEDLVSVRAAYALAQLALREVENAGLLEEDSAELLLQELARWIEGGEAEESLTAARESSFRLWMKYPFDSAASEAYNALDHAFMCARASYPCSGPDVAFHLARTRTATQRVLEHLGEAPLAARERVTQLRDWVLRVQSEEIPEGGNSRR